MAKIHIQSGNYKKAIELLERAQTYPTNLGEGKLFGTQENDIFYWIGCAFEAANDIAKSNTFLEKATKGSTVPTVAIAYNDQQPDKIFYQGLAWTKLKQHTHAEQVFSRLIEYGTEHLNDDVKVDFFAVSLPDLLIFEDDFNKRNRVHCHYMIGLGLLGLNDFVKAKDEFENGLKEDAMHFGCNTHLKLAIAMES
jgi:tetratricopeptide (TPR) repeat protein